MIRPFRPCVEALNDRLLPSAAPLASPVLDPGVHWADASSTEVRLTTDQLVYKFGQPINMTLVQTNVSKESVRVPDFCGSRHDFWLTRDGVEVWRWSRYVTGPLFACPLSEQEVELAPGQSRSAQGQLTNPDVVLTGRFSVGQFEVHASFDGVASNSVRITIQSPLLLQVMTDMRSYRRGMPVAITLTETNTSDRDVLVESGCPYPLFTVRRSNGRPVWGSPVTYCVATQEVLRPGETRTFTAVWDGRPTLPDAKLRPGRYVLEAELDGIISTVSFTLTRAKR